MSLFQKAVETVVKLLPDKAPDPLLAAGGEIGRPRSRVDGPRKVAGAARFTAEVPYPGLAYASLVCSTIPKGEIAAIDTAAAAAAPGVVLVMTHENAPGMAAPPLMALNSPGAAFSNLPVMQDARIRWNGEPVAVVVADSQERAEYAAGLVRVTYAAAPADLSFAAMRPTAKPPADIFGQPPFVKTGDAEAALKAAAVRVDRVYRTPRYNHCAIEPHATTAAWDEAGRLTVHDASQGVGATRYTLAEVFGLKEADIRVLAPFVGGAFGNKMLWSHQLLCVAAAKLAGRPVRLALSRGDVFRITGGRTLSEQRVALGAKPDGTLAALIHTGTIAVVSHNACPEQLSFPARHLYAADALLIGQDQVELDTVANASMRAPGESIGSFALESAVDELAVELGLDPIDLRRRIEPDKDPAHGTPFSSRNLLDAYARGAERFGWRGRNPAPGSKRDGEWLIGQGVATACYPYLRMPGGAARVRLAADGRAVVQAAAHEMGMGTATVQAQHAAERLGLPAESVTFEYGDTALPAGTVAGGSSQTVTLVAAVTAACEQLVKELLKLVGKDSPLAGANPGEIRARDGGLFLAADPARGETYVSILNRAGRDHLECDGAGGMPVEMLKYAMHSFGAQFCEVRVSAVTGEVRVVRWVGAFDCGRILNAKTAASQFRGGIVMGIGMALTEEGVFDERTGKVVNPSLAEYHVPTHADVPPIDVMWTDIPDPHAPLGLRGVGEIGITGVAAAIANAVYDATGKRVRELPMTPDKVLVAGDPGGQP